MSEKKNRKYPNAQFVVRVAGDLAYKDGDQEKTKPYDETVVMDQELIDEGALSMFVKHYVPQLFAAAQTPDGKPNPNRVTGFLRVLSHQLVSCRYKDNPERPVGIVSLMNRQDLLKYISVEGYPVEADLYPDDSQLQQAVLDCEEDEEAFEKSQAHRKKTQGPNIKNANKAKLLMSGGLLGPEGEDDEPEVDEDEEIEVGEEIEEDVDDDNDPATPTVKQKRVVKKVVKRGGRR